MQDPKKTGLSMLAGAVLALVAGSLLLARWPASPPAPSARAVVQSQPGHDGHERHERHDEDED